MIMMLTLLPGIFITLGITLFQIKEMGKVRRQVLLGITLPNEAMELGEVQEIQRGYQLRVKRFGYIGLVTGLIFITLINQKMSIQFIYFILWMACICTVPQFIHLPFYKKLKALKIKNSWCIGQKYEVLIDTRVTALKDKLGVHKKYFYGLLVFPIISGGLYITVNQEEFKGTVGMLVLLQLVLMLLFIGCNDICLKLRNKVYSENSEINQIANGLEKKSLSYMLLFGGVLTGILLVVTEIYVLQLVRWNSVILSLIIGVLTFLQVFVMIALYISTHRRIDALIQTDQKAILVDEDTYWINGLIYCNPKDPAMFVNARYGIGSNMNMGNPKSKLLAWGTGIFTTIILIYSIGMVVVLDFSVPKLTIEKNTTVWIDYPMYSTHFELEEIESVELLDELPPTSKTNGASTDEYARGEFMMKGYGKIKGYWYRDSSPYILVKLKDRYIVWGDETPEKTRLVLSNLEESMKTVR